MRATRVLTLTVIFLAGGVACGSPSQATLPAQPTLEAQPTLLAQPTLEALPTVAPTPVQPTLAPAATPAAVAQDPVVTTLIIDAANSRASYHAHEQLVGHNLPGDPVGTSPAVAGTIVLSPDGSIAADRSQVTVDLSKLASDESRRDNYIKSNTLMTSRYPTATFVPHSAQGLPTPLPASGRLTFQLSGDLTVHGVTRPVTWQVAAQFDTASVSGDATTSVNISDFGMTPPKAGPVLSIEDGLTLELIFSATRN
jgi:polyisoprenoid-binding protein YceI